MLPSGAHAAHVGDEVLGAEVARPPPAARRSSRTRVDARGALDAGEHVEVLEPGVARARRPTASSCSGDSSFGTTTPVIARVQPVARRRRRTTRSGTGFTRTYTAMLGMLGGELGADRRARARAPRPWRRAAPRPRGRATTRRASLRGSLREHVGLARGREEQAAERRATGFTRQAGCRVHERVAAGAAHELVALVEAAVLERDDALVGARLRLPRRHDLATRRGACRRRTSAPGT